MFSSSKVAHLMTQKLFLIFFSEKLIFWNMIVIVLGEFQYKSMMIIVLVLIQNDDESK